MSREPVSNSVLTERIRAKLGRYVANPAAIQVTTNDGQITVSGRIPASEVDGLLAALQHVPGVRKLDHHLDLQATGDQDSVTGTTKQSSEWPPLARVAASIGGTVLMGNCLVKKRTPLAIGFGTVGFGLCLRAVTNLPTNRLFGLARGPRGIDVEKTIVINAPITKVYELLSHPENYPRFSDTFKDVRRLGSDHYQKTMLGPGGLEILFDEIIPSRVENQFVASRSGPASQIQFAKQAQFRALDDQRTEVRFWLTYNRPLGILTHGAAWTTGVDPKALLDDLMMRAKSFLETGQQPHDATDQSPPQAASDELVQA